jgi:hypothetical protein
VLHGNRTFILQDENGQITETHSVSAGLDYPGVGPEHAWLQEIGRAQYVGITDQEALDAFHYLCRAEGIIPALESSHAVAYAMKLAKTMRADQSILVSLSGRGDKDIGTVADLSGAEYFDRPSMRGLTVKGAPGHDAAKAAAGATSYEPNYRHFQQAQGRRPQGPDSLCDCRLPVCRHHPSLMHGMVEAGADVIELGVPFSDPMADGPTIQRAGDKAIANGVGLSQVLAYVAEFRKRTRPRPWC